MRISERQGKDMTKLPLGLKCAFKGDFSQEVVLPERERPKLEDIHGKASYYRVISGEVVESVVIS